MQNTSFDVWKKSQYKAFFVKKTMRNHFFILTSIVLRLANAQAQTEIFEAIREGNQERFMQLVQEPKNVNAKVKWQEKT